MKTEKHLQEYFKREAKSNDLYWRKMRSDSTRGFPDVLVACNSVVMFCELKTPNGTGKLSKLQEIEIDRMKSHGLDVRVVSTQGHVDAIIQEIKGQ